jgi:hypothetical protein
MTGKRLRKNAELEEEKDEARPSTNQEEDDVRKLQREIDKI